MRQLIFHNFWLKIFSVALATVIWMAIYHGIQNDVTPAQPLMNRLLARQFLRVPVELIRRPDDPRRFTITPPQVIVTVAGPDLDLRRVSVSDLRALVDVSDIPSGKAVVTSVRAEAPVGDSVQDVRPPSVTVEEAPLKEK